MEPQLPKPQFSPEAAPSVQPAVRNGEAYVVPKLPEVGAVIEQGKEVHEALHDGPAGDPVSVQPLAPPPLPVITVIQDDTSSIQPHDPTPIAADDDLIEKEWVEKAKQVVAETRNDPHAQDAAVGKLQADYLKKRYGKVILLPKEE